MRALLATAAPTPPLRAGTILSRENRIVGSPTTRSSKRRYTPPGGAGAARTARSVRTPETAVGVARTVLGVAPPGGDGVACEAVASRH